MIEQAALQHFIPGMMMAYRIRLLDALDMLIWA